MLFDDESFWYPWISSAQNARARADMTVLRREVPLSRVAGPRASPQDWLGVA